MTRTNTHVIITFVWLTRPAHLFNANDSSARLPREVSFVSMIRRDLFLSQAATREEISVVVLFQGLLRYRNFVCSTDYVDAVSPHVVLVVIVITPPDWLQINKADVNLTKPRRVRTCL